MLSTRITHIQCQQDFANTLCGLGCVGLDFDPFTRADPDDANTCPSCALEYESILNHTIDI